MWANLWLVLGAAVVITLLKAGIVWALFRVTCARRGEALQAGSVLTGAGEFAFVLLPLGDVARHPQRQPGQPSLGHRRHHAADRPAVRGARPTSRCAASPAPSAREADDFTDAQGSVLVIGFGRFGQIVSQYLLAEEIDVTTIDIDPDMIQVAGAVRLQGLLRRRHAARRAARRRRSTRRG